MQDEIENTIKRQVDHIFDYYEGKELRVKMYDLAIQWYLRGFSFGLNDEKEEK